MEEKYLKILEILKERNKKNNFVKKDLNFEEIYKKLENNKNILEIIYKMEETGGEPCIVNFDEENDIYTVFDCSKETPKGRISVCYDEEARINRKKFPPEKSIESLANEIGIEILNEEDYKFLQSLGNFDTKTSSWIKTPEKIRNLGGAIFGDFRYSTVFFYHNSADSYYSSRGFRGFIKF